MKLDELSHIAIGSLKKWLNPFWSESCDSRRFAALSTSNLMCYINTYFILLLLSFAHYIHSYTINASILRHILFHFLHFKHCAAFFTLKYINLYTQCILLIFIVRLYLIFMITWCLWYFFYLYVLTIIHHNNNIEALHCWSCKQNVSP